MKTSLFHNDNFHKNIQQEFWNTTHVVATLFGGAHKLWLWLPCPNHAGSLLVETSNQ